MIKCEQSLCTPLRSNCYNPKQMITVKMLTVAPRATTKEKNIIKEKTWKLKLYTKTIYFKQKKTIMDEQRNKKDI